MTKVQHGSLTHECIDPDCHVPGFVATLSMSDLTAATIESVLAEHAEAYPNGCCCEGYEPTCLDIFEHRDEHRAHLAAKVAARLAAPRDQAEADDV